MLETLWADRFVEEANLPVYISNLRKIFKSKGINTELIKTVAGQGYVFIENVAQLNSEESTRSIAANGINLIDPAAVELYLKGKYIADTITTRSNIHGDLRQAIEFYDSKISLDSNFIDAYIGIGKCMITMDSYRNRRRTRNADRY